jgi:uncharacterized RDD family membrane protein YckC
VTGPEISAIPKEARAYQGQSAGVVSRVVANTIDAAVVGVMVGAIYVGLVSVKFLLDPRTFEWPSGNLLASLTTALFLATGYLTLGWWLLGRTYGDHVMGLRVVGGNGRRLGPLRSLLRALFCVFFPIGLFWCLVSPQRRSVQDVVLWTRVVYDWMPRPGASQRKTLLGAAPLAMEPPAPVEAADAAPAADPQAPVRRYRWPTGPNRESDRDDPHAVDVASGGDVWRAAAVEPASVDGARGVPVDGARAAVEGAPAAVGGAPAAVGGAVASSVVSPPGAR